MSWGMGQLARARWDGAAMPRSASGGASRRQRLQGGKAIAIVAAIGDQLGCAGQVRQDQRRTAVEPVLRPSVSSRDYAAAPTHSQTACRFAFSLPLMRPQPATFSLCCAGLPPSAMGLDACGIRDEPQRLLPHRRPKVVKMRSNTPMRASNGRSGCTASFCTASFMDRIRGASRERSPVLRTKMILASTRRSSTGGGREWRENGRSRAICSGDSRKGTPTSIPSRTHLPTSLPLRVPTLSCGKISRKRHSDDLL